MSCESKWFWVVLVVTSSLEYWLGKTKKTAAASLLELIWLVLVALVSVVGLLVSLKKGDENGR